MALKSLFFAGGGTGGHIYPALAVAERLTQLNRDLSIHFFCSDRNIDSRILSASGFSFTALPARSFSLSPVGLTRCISTFIKSCKAVTARMDELKTTAVVGIGGFVAAPVCYQAHKLGVSVKVINVDVVPGRANRLLARWADEVFVQFEETAQYFQRRRIKANLVGCPLRAAFENPQPEKAKVALGLDKQKRILLITGASSGSQRINKTVCSLLNKLNNFASDWQIVHLTGSANVDSVTAAYKKASIRHAVVDYHDNMADLLAAADLLIGRSGAVSVAEYAAALTPSICMPYPFHDDMHQYYNAGKLVEAGAAIIVDDVDDEKDRREWLWEELEPLLSNDAKRHQMRQACSSIANTTAATQIARSLL